MSGSCKPQAVRRSSCRSAMRQDHETFFPPGNACVDEAGMSAAFVLLQGVSVMGALGRVPLRAAWGRMAISRVVASSKDGWRTRIMSSATDAAATSSVQPLPFPSGPEDEGCAGPLYGEHELIKSQAPDSRRYADICTVLDAAGPQVGDGVWIRARVSALRAKGNSCFIVLRQGVYHTMQACYFKDKENPEESKAFLKWLGALAPESIVDVRGTIQEAKVVSASVTRAELAIERCFVISRSVPSLPFQLDDAVRTEEEIAASEATERPFSRVPIEQRLQHRWVDLRTAPSGSVLRVRSAVCQLFREALYGRGFVEIQSPKLIGGESEGGAEVFTTDYFGETACLAQSPQLYKQAAICADMQRVFEVGPVFRKEKSHTRRHLCEFTGLDMEMEIKHHYKEVRTQGRAGLVAPAMLSAGACLAQALEVVHAMFVHMFRGLEDRFAKELTAVRSQYPSEPPRLSDEPCIVHWEEAMAMLRVRAHPALGRRNEQGAMPHRPAPPRPAGRTRRRLA